MFLTRKLNVILNESVTLNCLRMMNKVMNKKDNDFPK